MDGSSIERRYSFNIAQTNPVAESTHLGSSFSWGSSISARPRSNSSLCLNNTNSPSKSKNVTKIDARIAADVQSKGLASRIVKYHESGTRLNRSMSAHSLYSKPGQFPAVTLKKTELPYRATRQELSMIRIPPPEKSTFYGNTISSLFKSNSIVGLQSKRTEENRPIIHPPPTENDMAPTRSVLDVLKEISRKRINSDDLETDENSKKYCDRGISEFVDAGSCTVFANTVENLVTSSSQRFKRQRDCITSHQSVHITEAKTSPEQAKKRICNYNNDITSSLSSSVKSRYNEKKRASYNLNHTIPLNLESYETQKAKIQCFRDHKNNAQTDMRFENLATNLRKVETAKPITPISTKSYIPNEGINDVTCQRAASDPICNAKEKTSASEIKPVDKPPLTLFNKKYEVKLEKNKDESSIGNTDELNNFDEYEGIPFVKPKRITGSGLKNPVIERTQKSKLALMLSGLRGELYQNSDKDDVDASKQKPEKLDDKKANVAENTSISASKSVSTVTTTLTTVTSSCNSNPNTGNSVVTSATSLPTNTIANVMQANTSLNKTTSPLVGLKLTKVKPSITNGVVNDTKTTETSSKSNVPVLGGFAFSTTNTSVSTIVSTTVDSKIGSNQAPIVSKASNTVIFNQPTPSNISTGDNLPKTKENELSFPIVSTSSKDFNQNTSSLSNISLNTTTSLKPANTFVFGANVTLPTTATKSDDSKTVESGSVLFSNSATKSNNSFNFSVPSETSTASLNPITFGSLATSTTTTSTISSNTVLLKTATSGITFGAVTTTSNATSIKPTTTSFSLTQNKTSAPTTVTTVLPTISTSTSTFNFGSLAPTTSASTFGANNNNTGLTSHSSNSLFSFGSQSKTQNSALDNKNNSNHTNNLFNSNSPTLFGASNIKASASAPLLGSSTNNTEKNVFGTSGIASTSSVFGLNSVNNNSNIFGSNTENKSSPFGASITNNSSPTPFNFGTKPSTTTTTTANNSNTAGGFSFGSSIPSNSQGGTFGFGNTIKQPATNNSSSNVFGTVSATAIDNKTFAFGSNSNKSENTSVSLGGFSFNSTATQKPSTFSFGAAGNSTTAFSFGGVSSPLSGETSNNKAFSFGTQQPLAQQSSLPVSNNTSATSNIFGTPGPSKTAPPQFNFNAGSSTNLQQQTGQPTNNIFAQSASNITTGPGDRLIRRATRRLQK